MIIEPSVAIKRYICIYLLVYINFYSFTDLSRGSACQRGGCMYVIKKKKRKKKEKHVSPPHPNKRLLPKPKHSAKTCRKLLHIQLGGGGCSLRGSPPLPAGFKVTLRLRPPALWPVVRWASSDGGGGGWQCVLDVLIKRHC